VGDAAGLRDVAVFGDKLLNSNSHGLRGTTEYTIEKPHDTRRVVVLGDSFAFGEEVSDDETLSAILGTLLRGAEVLNFGVHGYGHDQMLLYLQEEVVRYHPDVVLLGLRGHRRRARHPLVSATTRSRSSSSRNGRLKLTNVPIPTQEAVLEAEPYRSKLADIVNILYGEAAWDLGPAHRRAETVTRALLDEIRRTPKAPARRS
jgi:hypothetical protein